MILLLKSQPEPRHLAADNARLRAALLLAIRHLRSDQRQADLPAAERAEDRALIRHLEDALA